MEKLIDATQIKLIHVGISKLKMDDASYRYLLRTRYGIESCKVLTYAQADDLVNHLVRLGFKIRSKPTSAFGCAMCTPRERKQIDENITYLVSPRQLSMIRHLCDTVEWKAQNGFQRWLLKYFHTDKVTTSIQATKIIEGLKNLVITQRRCSCALARNREGKKG